MHDFPVPDLPVLKIPRNEFDRMFEYSTTVPTGTRIGKRWRRNLTAVGKAVQHLDFFNGSIIWEPDFWIVGEYAECDPPNPKEVRILWYNVEIVP